MSSTHWHFLWQRPQQLMSRLCREYNVLFVDPPYPMHQTEVQRERDGKVKNPSRLTSVNPALKILSSYQIDEKTAALEPNRLRAVNLTWLKEQIHQALLNLRWNMPALLWIYNPAAVALVGELGESGVVYDCVDSFSSFSWADPRTGEWEAELTRKADVVFASAAKLYEQWRKVNQDVYLVPNAADYEHFSRSGNYGTLEPPELKKIRRPRFGFIGAVYEWLDLKLLEHLAAANPLWSLIMVGPRQHGLEVPENYPNIHWLGPRDYKTLPWYLHNLDVMMIPFLRNQTTEHANPIKLWEYLAAGKPVVTTALPEIPAIAGVTWVSESEAMFMENCVTALANLKNPHKQKELINRARVYARSNSWEERCRQMVAVLQEKFQ